MARDGRTDEGVLRGPRGPKKSQPQERWGGSEEKQVECGLTKIKANHEGAIKRICPKKSVTGVGGLATPSTNATTQGTHWGTDYGGEKATATIAVNNTQ